MKLPSFRLKIALFSATLAGSALIGFAGISWFQIYNANISRLDAQIINELMRGNGPPKRDITQLYQEQRWKLYSDSLSDVLGANTKIPTGLLVLDEEGNKLYQTQEIILDRDLHRLLTKQLKLINPSPLITARNLSSQELPPAPLPILLTTESTKTGTWRIGTAKFRKIQIAVAVNLEVVNQEMSTISNIFLISILGILLLIAIGAWLLSGSVLRPIKQLTSVIKLLSAKGLDRRISIDKIDIEFLELIRVFNQMLERLERSFHQASRFSGDAAHELKTPLTILQGELERTLQQVPPGSEVQQRLSYLLDEVHRLSAIIRKLLLLSLADAGTIEFISGGCGYVGVIISDVGRCGNTGSRFNGNY